MADKIVVMHDGIVEQIGAPLDLYDHPANLFVAGFIGSPAMNFLKGKAQGGQFVADAGFALPLPRTEGPVEGQAVTLGLRPEYIRMDPNGFAAEVVVIEPTGSETQVALHVGTGEAQQEIHALFRERISARPGDIIRLAPQAGRTHLFSTETGQRLSALID